MKQYEKSTERLASIFNGFYSPEYEERYEDVLVKELPPLDRDMQEELNKIRNIPEIMFFIKEADVIIETLSLILKEPYLSQKIKMLNDEYISGLLEDEISFNSPEEVDKFILKEIKYHKLVKEHAFQRFDTIALKGDYITELQITIDQEKLILEAHEKGMSIPKAAKYADVSKYKVIKCWNKYELKSPYKPDTPISKEKQEKIREAYDMEMTQEKAAKYAKVSSSTVSRYWKKWGLNPLYHRKKRKK